MSGEKLDDEVMGTEQRFWVSTKIIFDRIIAELTTRAEAIENINDNFKFLNHLKEFSSGTLQKCASDLGLHYSADLSPTDLCSEILLLKNVLNGDNGVPETSMPAMAVLDYILKRDLQDMFPNTFIALRIYSTLPVTSASAERSFSKLKIIKNYLRSTMGQERLSNLAMLSIESEVAGRIDTTKIIDEFAEKKVRKINFL